jgi:hypothetical protein
MVHDSELNAERARLANQIAGNIERDNDALDSARRIPHLEADVIMLKGEFRRGEFKQ